MKIAEVSSSNDIRMVTQTVFYAVELWQDKCDGGCDGIDLTLLQHMKKIIQKRTERECTYVY